jgi:hypothetical protein
MQAPNEANEVKAEEMKAAKEIKAVEPEAQGACLSLYLHVMSMR